ncbi:MAG: Gellan lyase precursor [Planctomycetes bacterium ADurb.Bin126]|nr:MAG: Gellan lyase precursor [Planctomycetes bacterium ADurb.Bin126]HQL75210.1 polysaccharide deacetylase family protein [Phycisphaerae bacterium]
MFSIRVTFKGWLCLLALISAAAPAVAADAPQTRVARWKGDAKAAFLLMFDDNTPSQARNAIPEMKKRGFTGTFYVCPNKKGLWTPAWQKEIPASGMVLANHTVNHAFVPDLPALEKELAACNEALYAIYSDRPRPFLMSFGKPGTNPPLKLTDKQIQSVLPKYHLVDRGPFLGAAIHYKTGKAMIAAVDKAIAAGSAGYIVFHGVGGDWISAPLPDFIELLDYLAAKRDQVWVTDHISSHKYDVEQKTAKAAVVTSGADKIELTLTSQADPKLYDQPLTLITPVPASWRKCQVTQGKRKATVDVVDGAVRYEALPGPERIALAPAETR